MANYPRVSNKIITDQNCGFILNWDDFRKFVATASKDPDDALSPAEREEILKKNGVTGSQRRKRNRKQFSRKTRFLVLERCEFRCNYCGRSPKEHGVTLEVDHVFPQSRGGSTSIDNLVAACGDCNAGKSDRIIIAP